MSGSFVQDDIGAIDQQPIESNLVLVEDGPSELTDRADNGQSNELKQEDHAIASIQIDPANLILACS